MVTSFPIVNPNINSSARLTYDQVNNFFKNKNNIIKDKNIAKNLNNLFKVYKFLNNSRKKRHAVDFDTQEFSFVVGKNNET